MHQIKINGLNATISSHDWQRRKQAIERHPTQIGLDYIQVEETPADYKLLLYFIPSFSHPDKRVVPDLTLENIQITESKKIQNRPEIQIGEMVKGKWVRRIEPMVDTALQLDGKTRISCGEGLNLANRSFTIKFWAQKDSKGKRQMILVQGPPSLDSALSIGFSESDHFLFRFLGNELVSDEVITDSNWHHWACVYDDPPRRMIIYQDGKKVKERFSDEPYQGIGHLYLGSAHPPNEAAYFHGGLASIQIWNHPQNEEEIVAQMYQGLTGKEENLLAGWEASAIEQQTLIDQSGQEHHGVFPQEPVLLQDPLRLPAEMILKRQGKQVDLYQEGNLLTLTLPRGQKALQEKDISRFTLELKGVDNLDPFFARVLFRLSQDSESDPSVVVAEKCPVGKAPEIDYLTRDFSSFRKLMLDRMAVLAPSPSYQDETDISVIITEILAYTADYLSYYQDAVATEAYLGTARRRISVARHTRLLEYFLHEGCNARVWVQLQVEIDTTVKAGLLLASKVDGLGSNLHVEEDLKEVFQAKADFFETRAPAQLYREHNRISFYSWGAQFSTLQKGATKAILKGKFPHLQPGEVLIFEEVKGRKTGLESDANPNNRHAVRLTGVEFLTDPLGEEADGKAVELTRIEWSSADALPFDFYVTTVIEEREVSDLSVALGNIVLADHGRTIKEDLPIVASERYRPQLGHRDLTYAISYDPEKEKKIPMANILRQDPRQARAKVRLVEKNPAGEWSNQDHFYDSDAFTPGFVLEMEDDRPAFLRFGDGKQGKKPQPGTHFQATYRIGNGSKGNLGRDALAHVIKGQKEILGVRNPLSAQGGTDPEEVEQARLKAPQAFQGQERCVIPEDYAQKIESHPEVQKAQVTVRWTGSWSTVFITVDRVGAELADEAFCKRLRDFMEPFRIIGTDILIEPPCFVSPDIAMTVSLLPGYIPSIIEESLMESFIGSGLVGERKGFFHPDHFSFGQPVYLSQLIREAKKIPGIHKVRVTRLQRWNHPPREELERGVLPIGPREIIRLDHLWEAPEKGKIEFKVEKWNNPT